MANWLKRNLNFNQVNRDKWVASKTKEISAGSRVLDAGAGTCRYRGLFNHCHYVTQDFCEYNGPEWNYGKIDYVCDITDIPVEDGSFDVIFCTEVLEHVPFPIDAIKEFSRILGNRGKLLITAPLGCGIHQAPSIYYGGYTPYWYKKVLPESGFEVIEITPNGGFFRHYGQESARIMTYLFPKDRRKIAKLVLLPWKILMGIFLQVIIPLACGWLDKKYPDENFTVGYFVEAVKTRK